MNSIPYFLGLTSQNDFMHFCAHFGMSFALYGILLRFFSSPAASVFLIGLAYKLFEGELSSIQDLGVSLGRNITGILVAYMVLK